MYTRVGAHFNQVGPGKQSDLERELKYIKEKLKQMEMDKDRLTGTSRSQPPVNSYPWFPPLPQEVVALVLLVPIPHIIERFHYVWVLMSFKRVLI